MLRQSEVHAMRITTALIVLFASPCVALAQTGQALTAVPFQDVKINDAFWSPRIKTTMKVTVETNLRQCEITNRIRNFAIAGGLEQGKHEGALYNDSDVYKVLEGIAYVLTSERDPELEARTDAIIGKIAAAQRPDGYLNTYYTLVEPQNRWKNIQHGHELYCGGHLIEAAVAYYQATGKRGLLDVAIKFANHVCDTFGPGKRVETCGHEEMELALVKLYRVTNDRKYLDQAKFFLDVRGTKEGRPKLFGDYAQDHKPLREQTEVVGHAVRAMYLYCGMADVAALTGDRTLMEPLFKIWHDVVDRKMYVTGGIGPSGHNEGFTVPYDLPNESAYAETCAALGMALWNHRMFLMTGEGKYADVLEREVYNGLLSGVSLAGDKFFYTNPLGSKGDHHRVPWFDCSCCPTNVVRYLPAMGERLYAVRDNDLYTVLYAGSTANVKLKDGMVKVAQETKYPWDGMIKIELQPEKPFAFTLHLRRPGWCKHPIVALVNGAALDSDDSPDVEVDNHTGYVAIRRTWQRGDVVQFQLDMPSRRVHADPNVAADVGRVALMRGPVVYCLEGVDNGDNVRNVVLPATSELTAKFEKGLLGGVVTVEGDGTAATVDDNGKRKLKPVHFKAVPYYAWDNRAPGEMAVWFPVTPEMVDASGSFTLSQGIRVASSHCYQNDSVTALNDGMLPQSSIDHSIPRMTWWDHQGTTEWVAYQFAETREISSTRVYWFDDTGRGLCRVPGSWRILYRDGMEWKPVQLKDGSTYGVVKDRFNDVTFAPVKTKEIRLEVTLQKNVSGGILEWIVK